MLQEVEKRQNRLGNKAETGCAARIFGPAWDRVLAPSRKQFVFTFSVLRLYFILSWQTDDFGRVFDYRKALLELGDIIENH